MQVVVFFDFEVELWGDAASWLLADFDALCTTKPAVDLRKPHVDIYILKVRYGPRNGIHTLFGLQPNRFWLPRAAYCLSGPC